MSWLTAEEKTAKEKTKLEASIRADRDARIYAVQDRIDRYARQKAMGVATTDSDATMQTIFSYIQALCDVPAQPGFPYSVTWPTLSV